MYSGTPIKGIINFIKFIHWKQYRKFVEWVQERVLLSQSYKRSRKHTVSTHTFYYIWMISTQFGRIAELLCKFAVKVSLSQKIRIPFNPKRNQNISMSTFGRINEKVDCATKHLIQAREEKGVDLRSSGHNCGCLHWYQLISRCCQMACLITFRPPASLRTQRN